MDASLSKSVVENNHYGMRHLLIYGKYAKVDIFFPLFDQMVQLCKIPTVLSAIFHAFYILQLLSTSFWLRSRSWHDYPDANSNPLSIISSIFLFINSPPSYSGLLTVFILNLLFFVFSFICFFVQVFFYLQNLRFFVWALYISKFIIECLSSIFTITSAASFGASLYFYIDTRNDFYCAFIIFSLIFLIYFYLVFMYGNSIIFNSSCITYTSISAFTIKIPLTILTLNCISIIFEYLFYPFPIYTILIIQIIHMIIFGFIYYKIFMTLPYHHKTTNIIHSSVVLSQIVIDFLIFIKFLTFDGQVILTIILAIAIAIICLIINFFLLTRRYNSIELQQRCVFDKYDTEDNYAVSIPESEFISLYDQLGLNQSNSLALTYFHVGFTQMSPSFLNWSLSRYLIQNYKSTSSLCSVMQIVSFFPSESRQLNYLFAIVTARNDLSYVNRFLIYQIYRIKTLRQSSSSTDANERLAKLRSLTEQCISYIHSFWHSNEISTAYFEVLAQEEHRVNSLWLEAIRDYPNSAKLCDEYSTFLVECMSEFRSAVSMKYKSDMIERGDMNFVVDASFRSLIWSYPLYMKRRILDRKGNITRLNASQSSSSQSTLNSTNISVNVSEIVETENCQLSEEKHANNILNKGKLRLAADAALKNRKHNSFVYLPFFASLSFVVGFIIYLVLFFYIKSAFYNRRTSVNYMDYLSRSHFRSILANMVLFIKFLKREGDIDVSRLNYTYAGITHLDSSLTFIESWDDLDYITLYNLNISRTHFNRFLNELTELIEKSEYDIYPLVEQLVGYSIDLTICKNGQVLTTKPANMKEVFSYTFYLIMTLTMKENNDYLFNNSVYCETFSNQITLLHQISNVYDTFVNHIIRLGRALDKANGVLKIICALILFAFSFIPYCACSVYYVFHVDSISKILMSLDYQTKQAITVPIRKDADISLETSLHPSIGITNKVFITFILFLCAIIQAVICYGMLHNTSVNSQNINILSVWSYCSAIRLSASIDLLFDIIHLAVLPRDANSSHNISETLQLARDSLRKLTNTHTAMVRGSGQWGAMYGFDIILTRINYQESCELSTPAKSFHDTYQCASADRLVATVIDLATPILEFAAVRNTTSDMFDSFYELMHLMNSHLWYKFVDTSTRLVTVAQNSYESLVSVSMLFLFIGIIVSIIIFLGGIVLYASMISTYRAVLAQIKHIPPYILVSNKDLKNFLLEKGDEKTSVVSLSRNILHDMLDATLCVSHSGVVEMVNPAVTKVLGFTPEQVLGQSIFTIFCEEDVEGIWNHMNIIMDRQNGSVYEDHVECLNDNGDLLPVHLTLIAIQYDQNVQNCNFVFILHNEADLIQRQKTAEEAKLKSENLLYHILPEDIVMRLNSGEKDICFTVPSATIIFIDVVKFSEYAKNLTPQQIMGTLTALFSQFDNNADNYSLMRKIKLIGDVYMAAAGLFSDGQNPSEHANQTVRFALDCLMSVDYVNMSVNSNLSVRIGVNTGGPIIAGVLGTDKPVFDIIGDTINVASRLQSTDIPGNVQIPESTLSLLNKDEYAIEPRGEVFLKGKGQVQTYLIVPDPLSYGAKLDGT